MGRLHTVNVTVLAHKCVLFIILVTKTFQKMDVFMACATKSNLCRDDDVTLCYSFS